MSEPVKNRTAATIQNAQRVSHISCMYIATCLNSGLNLFFSNKLHYNIKMRTRLIYRDMIWHVGAEIDGFEGVHGG